MQSTFHGDNSLYAPWVAAQERQQHYLAHAARQRLLKECHVSPAKDHPGSTPIRHRIGGLLIDLGTRLSGSTTSRINMIPELGR